MRVVDPFSFFVGHASLIPGLGGPESASDLRYCFHTDYLDVTPGRAVFHTRIRRAQATFGELNIRIMALPPGRDASVAASIRIDLEALPDGDIERSLRFLAVESVQYALYAFATATADLQAKGLEIALEELADTGGHARAPMHGKTATAIHARGHADATVSAGRLMATQTPSPDLPFSRPMQWDPDTARSLARRWPLVGQAASDPLTFWTSGTTLEMLACAGLLVEGSRGLMIDVNTPELIDTLEACGCRLQTRALDGGDVDLFALDRAEGGCDFAMAIIRPEWNAAGRLETFCQAMMECLAKGGFLIMMIDMTGNGTAILFRNRIQQLSLYCIGSGHDVMQLAFPTGKIWYPSNDTDSRFAWIARK